MSRPQSHRVSTLSVLFTFSILSITQPSASLSPFASWLFSDKSSSSRLVLYSSDLNMLTVLALPIWFESKVTFFTEQFRAKAFVKCSLVKLHPLKFNTLSVRFTFSILSIAHPTTSQSRSVSWLFPVRLSSFRLVLCSSDLNMLTAPVLLIVEPINFNAWTDKLLASPTAKCLAVWSVRFFTISIDTCMPLLFSALKNSTQFSGVTSPMLSTAHHMVPLSIFTFLNPRTPTVILKVAVVWQRRDTAQLPLSLHDPISSVTSDVFLVSPLRICWAVGSITWQPLKFNILSVLLTVSILSIAQPTASLLSPSASWLFPNRSSSSKLGLCSSDLNMWVATVISRPQSCRVSTLSVLFTFSILSITQPTASLSPSASWLFSDKSSSSRLVLFSSDLNMWMATPALTLQLLRFNTLSVLFTFSILSIAQPTASLSFSASWLFADRSSFFRLVLYSSDVNMLTAPALLILQCFTFNAWSDWLSASPAAKCWAVLSVRSCTIRFETFTTLSFRALKKSMQFSGTVSLITHHIVPLSIFTLPTPTTSTSATCTLLGVHVGHVVTCWKRLTAQLPLSMHDPMSSVRSDVFLVSPVKICFTIGSLTLRALRFNTLSVLFTFSILSIAHPTPRYHPLLVASSLIGQVSPVWCCALVIWECSLHQYY